MNVVFPWPFSGLLNFMSFISFDISTLDCSPLGGERVYNAVYVYSLAPIIISLLIVVVGAIRAYLLLPVTHRAKVLYYIIYSFCLLSSPPPIPSCC